MPVRKLAFALLGLLSILALALLLWAPFLSLMPGGNLQFLSDTGRVRLGAGVAFVLCLVLRAVVRPPKAPSKRSIVWSEFAAAVGGTVANERRGIGALGWTGGLTVRWAARGVPVTLSTTSYERDTSTHLTSDVRMARPFQCHLVHESTMAKVLFSPQLWNVALAAVREREKRAGIIGPETGAGVADRMAFLAAKEILVGDPSIDDAFLIKTDTPDLAREFVVDAGVSCALHELDRVLKGWQLSLMWHGESHQLALVLPGAISEQQELEACRALMDASIRCLADRGMLQQAKTRAA